MSHDPKGAAAHVTGYRSALLPALLCLALAGCAGIAASVPEPTAGTRSGMGAAPTPPDERPTPAPATQVSPGPALDELVGHDGRLTVLILGSDARKGIVGERTDAMIVATMDPATGQVTMISLPRDTVNVPIGPGRAYAGRINSLFWEFARGSNKRKAALRKTREAMAYAFDVEIDFAAMVDFAGLVRLVDEIGGIDVKIKEPIIDPTLHLGERGLRLKAGTRHLDGKTALAFARTRHSDSDYERSGRQHQVIAAAADKVRDEGAAALPALLELITKHVETDMPMAAGPALLELAGRAKLQAPKSMVLAPGRFARLGSQLYTIVPRVLEVRKMFDRVLRPAG